MLQRAERFDVVERAVHWATAVAVITCIATAACLYVGPLAALVGRRDTVKTVHVVAGLVSLVPLAVGLVTSRALRADVRRLNRWLPASLSPAQKFNRGQQLNAALSLGSMLLLLGSGSIMYWFDPFPLAWRTGATFVHDWVAVAFGLLVVGHAYKGLATPGSFRSMIRG